MCKIECHAQIRVVRISAFPEVSQMGYRYRVVPIGYEGFVQPRKGQGKARQNWYCNNFVVYSYIYIQDNMIARDIAVYQLGYL